MMFPRMLINQTGGGLTCFWKLSCFTLSGEQPTVMLSSNISDTFDANNPHLMITVLLQSFTASFPQTGSTFYVQVFLHSEAQTSDCGIKKKNLFVVQANFNNVKSTAELAALGGCVWN